MNNFSYLGLFFFVYSSTLGANDLNLYLETSPHAQKQIESLQDVDPKLNSKDISIYNKVVDLIEASPVQAIAVMEELDGSKRSPIFDYILGVIYLQNRELQKAEVAFKLAIQKYPNFLKAHRALMKVHLKKEDFTKAKESVLKVFELGGANGELYGILAYIHYDTENYSSALSAFQMARVFHSDRLEYKRGELFSYIGLEKYREVISLCEELIKSEKNSKQYWIEQMKAYRILGETEKAIANLEILRDNQSLSVNETILLAQLYFNESMYEQSVPLYLSILDQPNLQIGKLTKPLSILVQLEKWNYVTKFVTSIEKSFQETELKKSQSYRLAKINLLFHKKDKIAAEKQLKAFLSEWPTHSEALLRLARYLSEESIYSEAIFYYERAALLEPSKHEAWRALGALLIETGNFKKAVSFLEKLNKEKPSEALKELLPRLRKRIEHE